MELPILPQEFSGRARKNVVDAGITASRTLAESAPIIEPFFPTVYAPSGNGQVICQFILPVFLAFAKEACALGQHGSPPWYSDRIDTVVRNFLRQLVVGAWLEYDRSKFPVFKMTSDFGAILPFVKSVIEGSEEWNAYQDLLLEVEQPAESPQSGTITMKRIGYRADVYAWMKRVEIDNVAVAAKRLGVSKSALKSIMSDKGKLRYGPELLQRVLGVIGRSIKGGEQG